MSTGWIANFFGGITNIVKNISFPVDIFDILVISVILYYAYKFVRDKRAGRLAAGVIVLIVALLLCDLIGMNATSYLFRNVLQVGVVAILILFQPEIRSALEKMGGSSIKGIKIIGEKQDDKMMLAIREVSSAAAVMSETKTGALIVFERDTKLGEISATGTVLDAQTSSFLIRNIFFNKAPLHDGAIIISDGKIYAAGCLLPLSSQQDINKDLGTRHRAALGLSENSDSVVVVVSEETGIISLVCNGKIKRGFTMETLRTSLADLLIKLPEKESKKSLKRKNQKNIKEASDGEK